MFDIFLWRCRLSNNRSFQNPRSRLLVDLESDNGYAAIIDIESEQYESIPLSLSRDEVTIRFNFFCWFLDSNF